MDLLSGDVTNTARDEILAKWKDKPMEELLAAKVESDLYIKTLEKRQDELKDDYLKQREELLAKAKFDEYLDRMEKVNNSEKITTTPVNEEKYDPKAIEEMVLNKIKQSKIDEVQVSNFNTVQSKLKDRFGENYQTVLKEQQSFLGLSNDDVNALAKKSPEAFFRLMNFQEPKGETFQTPPRSNQRSDNFGPKGQTKRDWNYYQELKKTNPTLYLDRKIAIQMHDDAIEQGDAFYS